MGDSSNIGFRVASVFTPASPPGNFDLDGDVDGFDFLKWQRGESPNPLSESDPADWEANYGTVISPFTAASTTVIPGEVPLSGACGWIQLLELEDRKLDRSGEVLAACGPIELVKDAGFSLPMPLATYFSSTSAYTFSGTW